MMKTNAKRKNSAVKKLIPAAGMLALSASMLATSTYAWFSMNKTVSVTNMTVTAKSNASYLLVQNTDNATNKTNTTGTAVAAFVSGGTNAADATASPAVVANTDKIVYPTYYADATGNMPGTASGNASLAVTAGHWYTANNANKDNSNNATTNIKDLGTLVSATTGVDLDNYMCTYNAWLSLLNDSENYTGKIKVTSTVASGDAGTSVVVTLSDGTNTETLKLANGTQATTTNDFTITSATSVAVTFYVYIDGTTTNVYSDYINNGTALTGDISAQFDIV